MSKAQEELLLWHSMLGHYSITNTQTMMSAKGLEEEPALNPKVPGTSTCSIPLCKSCLAGKARQIHIHDKHITSTIAHSDIIKDDDLLPGAAVSTDQYECRVKGRLPNTNGKEEPHKMLCGGTILSITGLQK